MTRALLVALAVLAASAPPAIASELTGIWTRDDGSAKLRFSACGGEYDVRLSGLEEGTRAARPRSAKSCSPT